ncbi:CAP domain-containing protein [Actinoallomurus rhizosphaericola]|uniref:CAP domain-containing protein n=1 Tax=Actinoallomurus rhizosphaericola TaxID=2952536 RepID=UPI002091C729|nr:CAP domain-containing protein [Actinoallomurus rhizosphaericola]MCO5994710.1 CAP domain-containing protein [Actinoallomurus rhizosphaericola]
MVRLTNAQRAAHGCTALRIDTGLRTAARLHSADMRDRNYFDHNSPDGRTPWDRIKAAGYTSPGAENIAKGYATPEAVVQGWMKSPGHRANILNCSLKAIGVGVAYGSGGPWWTQDFGFK